MITLKEVEVVLAVSKAGSFMSAAKKLRISQGNVSKIIAGLEKKLGVKLFVRACNGVILTRDGEYVRMYAEKIQTLAEKIRAVADEDVQEPTKPELKNKTA